jgi:hypothetical protein
VFTLLVNRLGQGVDLHPKPLDQKTADAAAELFKTKL